VDSVGLWLILLGLLILAGLWWLSHRCLLASQIDWGGPWLNRIDGFSRLFCRHYHRLALVELPLPDKGPAIVVANHISGLDPLLMIACSRRPLRFLIAREQYCRFGLQWLFRAAGCIPVDRARSPEKALRLAFKALREGEIIALFPHGKIHLASDPPRRSKAGASRLARNTGVPVIPLHISGVTRQGHVLSAVLLRSHARVECLPIIEAEDKTAEQLFEEIDRVVSGGSFS
jgi:1-acyl-sn-glycerol-3-phosphate acyltransferase